MPCKKCGDDTYKWGETGECEYDSKEACENANSKYSEMNKPTPLGKKTYEEYEKELKEYRKANELNFAKAQKVELGILQDGEKASAEVRSLIDQAQSQMNDLYAFQSQAEKFVKVINSMNSDIVKEYGKLGKSEEKMFDEKQDLIMTANKLKDSVGKLDKIANELNTIEKDMGLNVPGLDGFKKLAAQGKSFDKTIEKAYNKAVLTEKPSKSF
tara:strand:- start:2908 stop:3546 length:639 start_codon:yes stop_codon:yes gene_type:complete